MTQCSGELLLVLYEIQQRIHDIYVAARSCEGVRLRFVNQIELEGMVIAGLRRLCDGVRNRLQLVVQRRRFDDFPFGLQLVEDLLAHLHFLILILSLLVFHLRIGHSLILCWLTLRLFDRSLLFLLLSRRLLRRTADY